MKCRVCFVVYLYCLHNFVIRAQDPFKKICFGQSEIAIFASKKTFNSAKESCQHYGGHLVKVDNAALQKAIQDTLGAADSEKYLIGGKRSKGKIFKWIADDTVVGTSGYANWKPGQPNNLNGHEDCMSTGDHRQYQWTDVSCTNPKSRYICQRENSTITMTKSSGKTNFTCQSSVPEVLVEWKQGSVPISIDNKAQVYQITFANKSVLMLQNAKITDAGTYTCVAEAQCVTKQQEFQVPVDGSPTIRKIKNNNCNSSLFIEWRPNKAAVGFPHRFSTNGSMSKSSFATPSSFKVQRAEIPFLNLSSAYTVKITTCWTNESCDTRFQAQKLSVTNGITDSVTSASLVNVNHKGCNASWSPLREEATFTITTNCTVDKSRGTKRGNFKINKTANLEKTEFSFQPPPNHRCHVSVQAKGCGAISQPVKANKSCVTAPKEPDYVSTPIIKELKNNIKSITFTKPSEGNGLISCVFIILCYGKCPGGIFTIEDLQAASKLYKWNRTDVRNKIALAIPMSNISESSKTIQLSKGDITHCDVYSVGHTDHTSPLVTSPNATFYGKNQLNGSSQYIGAFIVTTTPSNNRILFKSSDSVTVPEQNAPTTSSTTTTIATGMDQPAQPRLPGWVVGLIVGISVLLIVAIIAVFLIRKKRGALRKPPEDQPNVQYIAQENEAAQVPQNLAPGVRPRENQRQANIGRVEEANPYANVPSSDQSDGTDIRVADLEAVYNFMRKNCNTAFNRQYNNVLQEAARITKPTTAASIFMKKNRYKNILPFDDCRVPLTGSEEGYINASYINGFTSAKKYIATQGPLRSTVGDFWMMTMDQNSHVIVMLTKEYDAGKKKCEKYWPDLGKSLNFSNGITVESRQETASNAYIERVLFIRNKSDGMTLVTYQYQFMKWPDHGVPQTTSNLIRMHRIVTNKINELQSQSPIIVHCSAGAGRTGAFLAYDYLLKEAEETGKVDVYRCVVGMRNQRIQMVQNADQYTLVYKLLVEAHIFVDYDYATDELKSKVANLESRDGSRELEREFRELGRMEPMKNSRNVGMEKKHRKFNRGQDAVPYDYSLVSVIMTSEETEPPYINASFIESYDSSTKMIAAQGPLDNTIEVFWRVVLDRGVTTIVMLNPLKEGKEEQCARYWPEKVGELSNWGEVGVVCRRDRALGESISERTLEITRGTETKTVTQFHFTGWKENSCPDDPSEILDVINKMQKHYRSTGEGGTVLIHCNDGIGRTGAFCTIVNLIDRVKWENRIDVFRTVKDLRDGRPNMVKTLDQYHFCYKAIANYLKSFELYANF